MHTVFDCIIQFSKKLNKIGQNLKELRQVLESLIDLNSSLARDLGLNLISVLFERRHESLKSLR